MKAPLPQNEADRLRERERYHVLDTPDEPAFNRITSLAARLFDAPISLISFVDDNRQWWKSCGASMASRRNATSRSARMRCCRRSRSSWIGSAYAPEISSTLLDPESRQPYPVHDLPLSRALRGESSDNVDLLVRKGDSAETLIRVTGRPLRDERGNPRGGIVTFNDITALRAAERELAQRALTDAITGLPNRRAFDERLALLVNEGCRGRAFALVLADIDHFKKLNDTHGHSTGDEVLAHVGKTLEGRVRCTDFIGRYGGEEFCVLFTDVDEDLATRLADNLRRAIADQNGAVPVTVSFGVCANRPHERVDPSSLIKAADRALYAAKSQGRNRVVPGQLTTRESSPRPPQAKARA